MIKTVSLIVQGRVQGVGYRKWSIKAANAKGVFGWVKNLYNGNVQMVVKGEAENVDAFVVKCQRGPLLARVDNLIVQELETSSVEVESGFKVI